MKPFASKWLIASIPLWITGCCTQPPPTEHQVNQQLAAMPPGIRGKDAAKMLEAIGLTIDLNDSEIIQLSGKRRTCFMLWDQLVMELYLDKDGILKKSHVAYDSNMP